MFVTALILPSAMISSRSRCVSGAAVIRSLSLLQELIDKRTINNKETIFLKF
jgi:hypothetical protein